MARQITLFKIGYIITDNDGGLTKRYAPDVFGSRAEAEAKVQRILDGHRETFKQYGNAFDGWYVDGSKVVSPDTVKRYIISEYTQTLYGE